MASLRKGWGALGPGTSPLVKEQGEVVPFVPHHCVKWTSETEKLQNDHNKTASPACSVYSNLLPGIIKPSRISASKNVVGAVGAPPGEGVPLVLPQRAEGCSEQACSSMGWRWGQQGPFVASTTAFSVTDASSMVGFQGQQDWSLCVLGGFLRASLHT